VTARIVRLIGALGVAAALTLAATGAAASPVGPHRTARAGPAYPVTVQSPYGPVTLASRPHRIVSLSPTATEMLFSIGAGHQVIAVDNDSNYPSNAPRTTLSGYTPNVEAIAGYKPDLVVVSYNPSPPNLVASLKLLDIPVLYLPAARDLRQTYAEITELGRLTGDTTGVERVVGQMRTEVSTLVAEVHRRYPPLTYFYELDPTLYTATSATFIGSLLHLAGLANIAGSSVHGSDYPQLSSETVVHANPTFVFLADGASVRSVRARPGWSALTAVRTGRVIELNQDIASRWGPRVVQLLREVVHVVNAVQPTPAVRG